MLKSHKDFHSTPFPDKTKEEIFLKSPKTPFLVIFARRGFFQKIWTLSTTSPYGHLTICKVSEKNYWVNSKKTTGKGRWMEGQKDRP